MAMSMKVHGGTPRAMHKSNACVGQMGEVLSHKIVYTLHQRLHFVGPCGNYNLLAKAWKCLNGPKEEPPIVSAMSLNGLRNPLHDVAFERGCRLVIAEVASSIAFALRPNPPCSACSSWVPHRSSPLPPPPHLCHLGWRACH